MHAGILSARLRFIAVAAVTSVTLTCAHAAAPDSASNEALLPPSQIAGVPIPAGQIDAAIAKLDDLAGDVMRKTGIPGLAIAVVRDGKVVYAKGFGVRRAGAPEPVDADTVFQLASLSKPVGATVVAREVGRDVVAWDTPLVKHLPWFALSDDWITQHVTFADMYAHRSGLPDHAGDGLEDIGYDRRQVLERLRLLPLHSFRDEYAYTNFGVTAAAEAVSVAAGTDWASLSEEAIYRPLGMASTSSRFSDFEHRPNHASGHVKAGGVFQAKYQRQPDAQSAAGGVSSSVRDMAQWMAFVLQGGEYEGKRIVPADALLPSVTAQIVSRHPSDMTARADLYGYGFGVGTLPSGRVALNHSGAFGMGAATNFLMIPSAGVGIVALSNAEPIGAVEALDSSFADLVQFGSVSRDWLGDYGKMMASIMAPGGSLHSQTPPASPAPPVSFRSLAGVYANDYYGDATIVMQGSSLVLRIGPAGVEYELRHWNANVFAYAPANENSPDGSLYAATFIVDAAGRATSLALESMADKGVDRFTKRRE